ncbi:NCS2 family permease [Desulfuromonas acetoxidans]|uniref:NCS2 family permease n=1 Tax=Desulfuromonas acetoxidans TaxID=891 RepID=UPI0029300CB0|nr:NCS2 family permease [Desulfuromonas acetoxidans]
MIEWLDRLFQLSERGSDVRTELIAGVTTFLTASYIIFVHPAMLAETGMDRGALTTVTCLVAALATLLVAIMGNAPLMMAPGMGLNAFFTYGLVMGQGVSWQTALGVVFLSGVVFLLLSLLGVRQHIVKAIPLPLQIAAGVGIGLFIAFIGLQNLGLVVRNQATMVQLGSFSTGTFIGLLGLLLIVVLEIRQVRGAMLIGIVVTTVVGMALGHVPLPDGIVSLPPSPAPLAFQLDIASAVSISLWSSVFSFMFVDLFDSLGTLVSVCRDARLLERQGTVPLISRLLNTDALATIGGALLGTSTTTTFIESGSGVSAGGRTGLTAVATAAMFLLALFFTPLIAIVPPYATAPALIVVGLLMMRHVSQIPFNDIQQSAPAFLTIIMIPLGYSISTGLAFGFISYVLIQLILGQIRQCSLTLIVIALLSAVSLMLG